MRGLGFGGGAFEVQGEQALQDFFVHGAIEIFPGLAQAVLVGFELRVGFRGEIVERTSLRFFPDFNEIVPALGGGSSARCNRILFPSVAICFEIATSGSGSAMKNESNHATNRRPLLLGASE